MHNYWTLLFDIPCINNQPQQYFLNLLLTQSILLSSRSIISFCSGLMYIRSVEISCWIRSYHEWKFLKVSAVWLAFQQIKNLHNSLIEDIHFSIHLETHLALSGRSETLWLSCQDQLKIKGPFQWRMALCLPSRIPNIQICGSNGFWTFY